MESTLNFENIFREGIPACLVLRPDGPYFYIVDANDAYLKLTNSKIANIKGRRFQDAFPANSDQKYYESDLLLESFRNVLNNRDQDKASRVRIDFPIADSSHFHERYWMSYNSPVFDENAEVAYILHSLKEVTEQVQIERQKLNMQEELIEAKQQFQHFVQTNPDGLFSMDVNGNFTSANPGLAAILEADYQELMCLDFISYCTNEDREYVSKNFQKASKGETIKFEANFISTEGRELILEISLVPIYVIGNIIGVYGIARDISRIKHSEKLVIEKNNFLQASATFISTLLNSDLRQNEMQEALTMIGEAVDVDRIYYFEGSKYPDGEVRYSQKFEWTNEYSAPQMNNPLLKGMPRSLLDIYVPDLKKNQIFTSTFSEVSEGPQSAMFKTVGAKSMVLLPIFREDELLGIIGFDDCRWERRWSEEEINFLKSLADNFTSRIEKLAAEQELKKQEEALRQNDRKFRALVQEGSDLIGIIDNQGNYKFVSESIRSLGYAPEELIGTNVINSVHPNDVPMISYNFSILFEKKQLKIGRFRFRDAHDNWRWLETIATDLSDDPAVSGVVFNSRDITYEVVQEQEIAQIRESSMAEITAQKDELSLANKRFEMARKASNEVIWDWDLITDKLSLSSNFFTNFGYRNDGGLPVSQFWYPKIVESDRKRIEESLKDAVLNSSKTKWEGTYDFRKASGEIAHLVDRAYILRDDTGKATRMVGSILDATSQKQALKKIQEQNELLKEIAWEQSHLVRAPLARLQGLIQFLELKNFNDMSQEEIMEHIVASTEELDSIIRNIVSKTHRVLN